MIEALCDTLVRLRDRLCGGTDLLSLGLDRRAIRDEILPIVANSSQTRRIAILPCPAKLRSCDHFHLGSQVAYT